MKKLVKHLKRYQQIHKGQRVALTKASKKTEPMPFDVAVVNSIVRFKTSVYAFVQIRGTKGLRAYPADNLKPVR